MLTQEEREEIVELLLLDLTALAQPQSALRVRVGPEFSELLPIDIGVLRDLVVEALRICVDDELRHTPPWLALLLAPVALSDPVPRVLARLANPPPKPVDPLDALLLSTDVPFVNRSILRDRLRVLSSVNSMKKILVVTGPHASGKSFTRELITHLCGSVGKLVHCAFPLQPGQEAITGASEIARDLVQQMGRPTMGLPAVNSNEDAWVREVAGWVLSEALSTPFDWWLVLDGFNHPDLRPDAKKLIIHLADRVNMGLYARRCRLILLGFDRTSLTVAPGKILVEEVDPVTNPVTDAEVLACVKAILERTGKNADAAQLTMAILQDLPAGEERLPILNQKLVDLL